MKIHQWQCLQFFQGGRLISHPYQIVHAVLRHITPRHGKVLGSQQILKHLHREYLRHIGAVICLLARLLQLLFPFFQLLPGSLQLLLPGFDLLQGRIQLGLRQFHLIFTQIDLGSRIGKLHRRSQFSLFHLNQTAVYLADLLVQSHVCNGVFHPFTVLVRQIKGIRFHIDHIFVFSFPYFRYFQTFASLCNYETPLIP